MNATLAFDRAEIIRAVRLLIPAGAVTELRALDATTRGDRYPQTWSGYFDSAEALADAVASLASWRAVYFVPNEINPALLARAANRIRPPKKDPLTSDGDIIRRRYLLIDTDPVRPSGISSTDAEHAAATERAEYIAAGLALDGWEAPVIADSGNGGHLLYRIDEPADDGGLVARCLAALAAEYSDDVVKVDTSVFNPARIWKLYGTVSRKGDNTPDRPHRMARILSDHGKGALSDWQPPSLATIGRELLEELASKALQPEAAQPPPSRPTNGHARPAANGHSFDRFEHTAAGVRDYLSRHSINVSGEKRNGAATYLHLAACPVRPDIQSTGGSDISVRVDDSGKIAYVNQHERGRGLTWLDLRDVAEPGYRAFAEAKRHNAPRNGQKPGNEAKEEEAPKPQITAVADLLADNPELRPPLIHGLLRRTEIGNIIAPPKRAKSWLALQIAISVATGETIFGTFRTERGRVLLIDNELHPNTLAKRIPAVAGAMGVALADLADRLDVDSLRGRMADVNAMATYFAAIESGRYSLIILDALYRFMPREFDENSNAQMTQVFNQLDLYARFTGAAFLLVHHASKGLQSGKAITDVGAGAGAISRAADAHLILRDHEEEGVAVLESVVRSWAPSLPICIRWDYPVWRIADGLDPADLRQASGRRTKPGVEIPEPEPKRWTPAEFAAEFVGATPRAKELILARATAAGMSLRDAGQKLLIALDEGKIFTHPARTKNDRKVYYATVIPTVFSAAENDSLSRARPPHPP